MKKDRHPNDRETLLVSACLLGIPCRYDGKVAADRFILSLVENQAYLMVPVCPEQSAGLPTPREPVEILGGDGFDVLDKNARVLSRDGTDVTDPFIRGAEVVLEMARITGAKRMIGKKRSPSCSPGGIYDGTFSKSMIKGCGVCSAALRLYGIDSIDPDTFRELQKTPNNRR